MPNHYHHTGEAPPEEPIRGGAVSGTNSATEVPREDSDFRWTYQTPATLWACSRPFVLKGILQGAVNLVYIIQVWDDDASIWVDLTKKLRQSMSLGSALTVVVDPSQILTDSLVSSYPFEPADAVNTGLRRLTHNLRKWKIQGTPESINPVSGLLEHNHDRSRWVDSETHYVVDAAIQHMQVARNSEKYYLRRQWITGSLGYQAGVYRWATNRPDVIHRCDAYPYSGSEDLGYNDFLSFFVAPNSGVEVKARFTDEDGLQNTFAITQTTNQYGHMQVGAGTRQLKNYLTSANWNTITTNLTKCIKKIEYWIERDGVILTNILTTLLSNKNCCIEDTDSIEIVWKNRMGGNDTFMLKGATQIEENHEFDLFQRTQGFRHGGGENPTLVAFDPYAYNTQWSQGSTNIAKINIRATKKLKVISQFMNQDTIKWAAEIVTAPRVWIRESYKSASRNSMYTQAEDEFLQQVYVSTTDVTLKDKKTGLGQLEIDMIYANPVTTQRI